mmetsp:Transcript_11073/g.26328  ORF Transcript_11073/g.26328 Transcript_11073/m.26328 type:complete len:102 (+) Transcript_11073:50-355(+)
MTTMATTCRVNNHTLLLVVGTALGTWLISSWLSFVRYSPDALVGPTGGVFCSDSPTKSSQSTASRLQTRDGSKKSREFTPNVVVLIVYDKEEGLGKLKSYR